MTPEEIKFIYTTLVKRVAPRDAKEGAAVALTPSTWLTIIVNGVTYYQPLWT